MRPKFPVNLAISLLSLAIFLVAPAQTYAYGFNISYIVPNFTFSVPTPPPMPSYYPRPSTTAVPASTTSPTPRPTLTPSPTPTPKPSNTPLPSTSPTSTTIRDYLVNAVNNYRQSQGLFTVSTDTYTCDFAKIRAQEISINFNHNGFSNRINSHTLPYPGYHLITENIAMTSNYTQVVNMWINSPGHAANMRADTPYVCVEKYGNYYAYEGWKP